MAIATALSRKKVPVRPCHGIECCIRLKDPQIISRSAKKILRVPLVIVEDVSPGNRMWCLRVANPHPTAWAVRAAPDLQPRANPRPTDDHVALRLRIVVPARKGIHIIRKDSHDVVRQLIGRAVAPDDHVQDRHPLRVDGDRSCRSGHGQRRWL